MRDKTAAPARQLVEAFGDCSKLETMYTEHVSWRLNYSLAPSISGPHTGRMAVCAFNQAVFNKFYEPGSVSVEVLDEVGNEASSVVRFIFRAMSRRGNSYAVEYVIFVKTTDGKIHEVIELLDTHASNEQHQGKEVGVPPAA